MTQEQMKEYVYRYGGGTMSFDEQLQIRIKEGDADTGFFAGTES